jgi:hypothetical protein
MIIHGFAFIKYAKPVHEHHLQALPSEASLVLPHLPGLKATPPNGILTNSNSDD